MKIIHLLSIFLIISVVSRENTTHITHEKNNIKSGKCKKIYESICRTSLESIFPGYYFPSVRPNWLQSTITKCNLELDCYNHEMKLALEYNGIQHYVYPNVWHPPTKKGEIAFIKGLQHDIYKSKVCKKLGINLIIVPYTIKKHNLKQFIIDQLKWLKLI